MSIQKIHPWVEVAEIFKPQPVPTVVKFDNVTIMREDGLRSDAALLTVGTIVGVMSVFIESDMLDQIIDNIADVKANMNPNPLFITGTMPKGN